MENLDVIRQVRITKETNEEIVKIAEKWRVPYSTVIRLAIDRYLEYVKGQNAIDEYIEKNPNTQESELLSAFKQFAFDVEMMSKKQ